MEKLTPQAPPRPVT